MFPFHCFSVSKLQFLSLGRTFALPQDVKGEGASTRHIWRLISILSLKLRRRTLASTAWVIQVGNWQCSNPDLKFATPRCEHALSVDVTQVSQGRPLRPLRHTRRGLQEDLIASLRTFFLDLPASVRSFVFASIRRCLRPRFFFFSLGCGII